MGVDGFLLTAVTLLQLLAGAPAAGQTAAGHTAQSQAAAHSSPCRSAACHIRRYLQEAENWDKKKQNRETIGSAYASQKGGDPTVPGDAFTFESAEASATSSYDGVYYNDGGKSTLSGDMAKGGWAGAYSRNIPDNRFPNGVVASVSSNFDTEMSSQRGPMAIAGTYEGARATAGSSAWWNLAQKDSIGGAVLSSFIDVYGPTPGKPTTVRKGDDPYGRRSVAFTNIAPNSAAQSGAGNGPAAVAAGYEVAAAARAGRDRKQPKASLGHREKGSNGIWDSLDGRRRLRHLLTHCL